jgi:hypothetical protein
MAAFIDLIPSEAGIDTQATGNAVTARTSREFRCPART